MGCGSSASVKTDSEASLKAGGGDQQVLYSRNTSRVGPEATQKHKSAGDGTESMQSRVQSSIAFEVMLGDDDSTHHHKAPPKRLSSRLDPIDAPRLTAEELEEKLRLAERKRNNELESRAKTASESRRASKRKRELRVARELERQHSQAKELEAKLKSAEQQRDIHNQNKSERQRIQEERIRRARQKKERLLADDDVISDVERDENFNNDDVDSWLEGSNNETNTVDTGFSSATSERIYSGRESPKKRYNSQSLVSRSSYINSASTVDTCDAADYKQSRENLKTKSQLHSSQTLEEDEFFDS